MSHSFSISLDNIENQDAVLTALEKIDGIDNIRHGQTETEVLLKASRVFNVGSILVMLLLGVISIMIIINTIRISVMNRRVEINIMKYVGATDWFIGGLHYGRHYHRYHRCVGAAGAGASDLYEGDECDFRLSACD